ncbi:MAG: poly-beta-1,6-N-acetyl-D-glucosamine biosynthesis protein PgaD [bacterium (Candidatus Stahlbacteria) CG23_combo_of_CG06-09_8_20_14_all_40_9]|nr:MAG: poly-beta-1,6-N-acetyl-D-glucosamine biosynthesis protein PgaD [bacterium (Candidatus Stahlbacteria) CG23_combo_of_CG06-09_8_20_14_all_40_9]
MSEIEIIDKPKLKSFIRNLTEMSFTVIIWGFWLYLFLPLLTFVLWLLGIRYFYTEVIEAAGYRELINLWGKVGWSILGIFLILRLWGYYNYWRFGKRERRKRFSSNTYHKLAEYFQIPLEQLPTLQSSKEVVWPMKDNPEKDVAKWITMINNNNQKSV